MASRVASTIEVTRRLRSDASSGSPLAHRAGLLAPSAAEQPLAGLFDLGDSARGHIPPGRDAASVA